MAGARIGGPSLRDQETENSAFGGEDFHRDADSAAGERSRDDAVAEHGASLEVDGPLCVQPRRHLSMSGETGPHALQST